MTVILDGKKISNKILDNVRAKIEAMKQNSSFTPPHLVVILVGDNQASKIYVNNKKKAAEKVGIKSTIIKLDENIKEQELLDKIDELNNNSEVTGILVQLPLPEHIDKNKVVTAISPKKDVDGFHPINVGRLNSGLKPYAICCTPLGIIKLLEYYNIEISGKRAVVIGRSNIVGKPMAQLLLQKNATVTIAHSKTKDLKSITKQADIIISATGQPHMLTKDMIKKGVVVIDVGILKDDGGHLCGEVDFDKIKDIASYITPVPGGVGPMTIAMLMQNTYNLFKEAQHAK